MIYIYVVILYVYLFFVVSLHSWHFSRKDRIRSNKYMCVWYCIAWLCACDICVYMCKADHYASSTLPRERCGVENYSRDQKYSDNSNIGKHVETKLNPCQPLWTSLQHQPLSNINPWKSAGNCEKVFSETFGTRIHRVHPSVDGHMANSSGMVKLHGVFLK